MPRNRVSTRASVSPDQLIRNFELVFAVDHDCEWPEKPESRWEVNNVLSYCSECAMRLSLASLRHVFGIGDASAEIELVISSAEQAAGYWKKWHELPGTTLFREMRYLPNGKPIPDLPRRIDGVSYRFAAMAIISLIVRREMSRRILAVVPKTKDFGDIANDFHYWNFTDAGLVEMLQTGRRPRRWREILAFATKRFRNDQIEANFESYASIILNCHKEKWDAAVDAFHKSEQLYAKRPNHYGDKTYFEAWESSSPRAPAGMDLRLAALLKYCFRKNRKLLASIDSVHKW